MDFTGQLCTSYFHLYAYQDLIAKPSSFPRHLLESEHSEHTGLRTPYPPMQGEMRRTFLLLDPGLLLVK